jgi:amino acid transporter
MIANAIFNAIVYGAVGWGGVLTNWGYLFWAGQAPLNNSWPLIPLVGAMVAPSLITLAWISAIGEVFVQVLILSAWSALVSRLVFAWSMDRVIPSWFSAVNPKTKSPIRLILLACVAIFIFGYLDAVGANPTITMWFTVIMAILSWFMPGFNAILLPFRRKDLFELAPSWARKKILGLYLLPILGVIWILFMCWDYIVSFVAPFIAAVTSAGLAGFASYSISTGIVAVVLTNVVGAIIWFISKAYNKKKGITFKDIFNLLPPE